VGYLAQITPDGLDAAIETLALLTDAGTDPGMLGRRARHVVSESARVAQVVRLVRSGDLRSVGAILDASHASLRDDFEVSSDELDLVCEAGGRAGALGSRMIGGGFGGSCISLVERDQVATVASAVLEAFAVAGLVEPVFLRAVPDGPAGPVRHPWN
jgi:galactokinase